MLILKDIIKEYTAGDSTVRALKGVSINFRESEFVSILGPSGCGKTTLLNIIGGLDHYTDGDLIINGRSTKEYRDADWDTYRNHSIGFVFQTYNLIPHQTVLANVELAMTLSGVSKTERRRRAKEALERVGLGDQLKKKPNQMSGGQMQRVAIARALVNDPDILLADEPTGALDTETSIQVMDILREVAKDRLVIMVTHNPELAERYSTRTSKLLDGKIIGDTNPLTEVELEQKQDAEKPKKLPSMSFMTALSLSLNNLMTKKGRTILTAFAGSIGIIGIALILSMSNGIQNYIDRVQEDTLSSYPLTIAAEDVDMTSMISSMTGQSDGESHELDAVYSDTSMAEMMNAFLAADTRDNNLKAFNDYITSDESGAGEYISTIKYTYDVSPQIYYESEDGKLIRVNPSSVFESNGDEEDTANSMMSMAMGGRNVDAWYEMLDNQELLDSQYDVIAGRWPQAYDEVILITDENNEISEIYLYSLGLKDPDEVDDIFSSLMNGEKVESETVRYDYEELLNTTYKMILPTDYYRRDEESGRWIDMRESDTYMDYLVQQGVELKVVGIVRPKPDSVATALSGAVGYTHELTDYIIDAVNNSEIAKEQRANPDVDVFTGLAFETGEEKSDTEKAEGFSAYIGTLNTSEKASLYTEIKSLPPQEMIDSQVSSAMEGMTRADMEEMLTSAMLQEAGMDSETVTKYLSSMTDEEVAEYTRRAIEEGVKASYASQVQTQLSGLTSNELAAMLDSETAAMSEEELAYLYDNFMDGTLSESTYEDNMSLLGAVDLGYPETISIYASSFEAKDEIIRIIGEYNDKATAEGREEDVIHYTDYVGLLMSSITNIVDIVSYVLIAFVSVSLVVSSIMIGIITYISVLERTKEIGILRSIGASKRDVSRVFNAETLIVGFAAGAIGIIVTLLLNIPISLIVERLTDVPGIASLPALGGVILVLISMFLTFIAGLIPSRLAAKKDPVEALRTE